MDLRKGTGANDKCPFCSELVDNGSTDQTTESKHSVVDGSCDVRRLGGSETSTTESWMKHINIDPDIRGAPEASSPAIASAIAGPQNACTLSSIICVKLCCQKRFHSGTVLAYSSMLTLSSV
jgi:hypothetical protein